MNRVLGIELWTSSVKFLGCSLDGAVQGLGAAENRAGPARLVAGHGYRGPPSSRAGRGRDRGSSARCTAVWCGDVDVETYRARSFGRTPILFALPQIFLIYEKVSFVRSFAPHSCSG